MIDIYMHENIKEVELGNEDMGGKYPTITFVLTDESKITISLDENGLEKLKEFAGKYEIKNGRSYKKR